MWTGDDGGAGSATRLKLVANSWVLAATAATGEVLALSKALDAVGEPAPLPSNWALPS